VEVISFLAVFSGSTTLSDAPPCVLLGQTVIWTC
jgi:hypothetical protein